LFVSGLIPGLPPAMGIPLTIIVFISLTFTLGLIHRGDLAFLSDTLRLRYGRP